MSLDAGSIEVDENGEATGSGLALAMFNGALSSLSADVRAQIAESCVPFFEGMATAIVEHIVANAEVTVTIATGASGLQRTPNPNLADTDTQGPSVSKTLPGTVA